MNSWEGDVRTGICEEVGCDDLISRVEAMEGVRNGDKCCADYGSLDGRKKRRGPKSTDCQPVHSCED